MAWDKQTPFWHGRTEGCNLFFLFIFIFFLFFFYFIIFIKLLSDLFILFKFFFCVVSVNII